MREGLREDDPASTLESPKLPRSLPKSLSEAEVEALLGAPDTEAPHGLRDRAMLETLYASGLRVSELVGLRTVQVSLDMDVVDPRAGHGAGKPTDKVVSVIKITASGSTVHETLFPGTPMEMISGPLTGLPLPAQAEIILEGELFGPIPARPEPRVISSG